MKYDVIIIGGGASGMAAAATIKNKRVCLIEGSKKLGKKLSATGNGRCNLTNENLDISKYHGDTSVLLPYFASFSLERIISFFNSIGIITKADEENRVYPLNLQAQAVNEALFRALENNNTDVFLESTVISAEKRKEGFLVKTSDNRELISKNLIFASGGLASPKLSCKNESYAILKSLGHTVSFLSPSIVHFTSKDKFLNKLSGVRAKAKVTLKVGDRKIREEKGEVQFADKSLSGICVMQLSTLCHSLVNAEYKFKEKAFIELDLLPDYSFPEALTVLKNLIKTVKNLKVKNLLSGILNLKLANEIINKSNLNPELDANNLKECEIKAVLSLIKSLKISVEGLKGFEDAQVTSGGVLLKEIDLNSMESKRVKDLYLTGELLNIHGDCGGYNLHFAFLSGIIAAEAINKK